MEYSRLETMFKLEIGNNNNRTAFYLPGRQMCARMSTWLQDGSTGTRWLKENGTAIARFGGGRIGVHITAMGWR